MRFSFLKCLLLPTFLLVASSTVYAVILVPQYQTVNLDYYESEAFELSQNATLNILPGGSAELYRYGISNSANLNIVGGEVRNGITGTSEVPELYTSDYFSQIDFYGHVLSLTDPVLLNSDFSEAQYNTQVTGHLSDGNFFIDMSVTYIVEGEYGGVTLHP